MNKKLEFYLSRIYGKFVDVERDYYIGRGYKEHLNYLWEQEMDEWATREAQAMVDEINSGVINKVMNTPMFTRNGKLIKFKRNKHV